ncbi:hypothetical protein BVX97_00005, partial [bacterium E08(2017)]
LLPITSPSGIVVIGTVFALVAGLMAIPRNEAGIAVIVLLVAGMVILIAQPRWLDDLDQQMNILRWKACGVLPEYNQENPQHVESRDTLYQNLSLFKSFDQYSLYGNGNVLFSFPDPITDEHEVHFIMGQNPRARSVLLLGGNPAGEISQLLKYPITKLVYVELDSGVTDILSNWAPEDCEVLYNDSRVEYVTIDGPRYVAQSEELFDVVIINAPEPSSAWENRYYTREFYNDVWCRLSPKGYMCTSLTLSVRLQDETARLGSSIYKTLQAVFPVVLATAGDTCFYFAGKKEAGLTFDRQTLFERSNSAGLENEFFRPEYFLGLDDIDSEKSNKVLGRFDEVDAPPNTIRQPVGYF